MTFFYYNLFFKYIGFFIFQFYLVLHCNLNFYIFFFLFFFIFLFVKKKTFFLFKPVNKFFFFSNNSFINVYGIFNKKNFYLIYFFEDYKRLFLFFYALFFSILIFYFNFFYNISSFNFFNIWTVYKLDFFFFNFDWVINFDYINLYFIILTNFIFFMIILTFFNTKFKNDFIKFNMKLFFFIFFFIEICLIFTFSTSNIFFFFFFFESSLIPLYLLIQIWGRGVKKKQYASISLVFFTLSGSIFLLFAIIYIYIKFNTLDLKMLTFEFLDFNTQLILFFFFFLGFAVKVPIFPFYSWLPEAHVEASTAVSILLAAIFLKIATYGILKIVIPNFFLVNYYYYSIIFYFSIISIAIGSFLSLLQTDLKKIIALSSIIHMNYMIIALFSLDAKAILSSFMYMFAHALVSSGLFFLVGIIYENNNTRDLLNFNNLKNQNSKLFLFLFLFNLANISFPLTISFISEIILLNNIINFNLILLLIVVFFLFFSVIYSFWMLHNVFFNKLYVKKNFYFFNKFDIFYLSILFFIIFLLGILPNIFLFNLEQEIFLILAYNFYLN